MDTLKLCNLRLLSIRGSCYRGFMSCWITSESISMKQKPSARMNKSYRYQKLEWVKFKRCYILWWAMTGGEKKSSQASLISLKHPIFSSKATVRFPPHSLQATAENGLQTSNFHEAPFFVNICVIMKEKNPLRVKIIRIAAFAVTFPLITRQTI